MKTDNHPYILNSPNNAMTVTPLHTLGQELLDKTSMLSFFKTEKSPAAALQTRNDSPKKD